MDEELLKKILGAAGVNITPEQLKSASEAFANSNPPSTSGASSTVTPETREKINSAIVDALNPSGSGANYRPIRWPSGAVTYERKGKRGGADFKGSYSDEELKKIGNDWSQTDDPLRGNRLDAQKKRNEAPQAEAARRRGIRDSNSVDISKNISAGLTGRQIFQDKDGKVEGPAELKSRLMKEGTDIDTATIAAGERYRDMFDLPNAKSEGWGMRGGQRDAVMNAPKGLREDGTSPRMDVMESLRNARADNLKSLTEQRLADPARRGKSVGTITSIESSDGRVLAKRGEGESVVARGGTQGAMGGLEDRPGALTLTPAGENAIRDRLIVQETSAPTDKPLSGSRVVTGRYGTAIGGTSVLGQMKNDGTVPKDFNTKPITEKATVDAIARPPLQSAGELTTREVTRTVGQAPLPEKYAEGRDKILAEAGQTARAQGEVVGDAKPLLDRMAPGTAQAIDQKSDRIAADLKQQQSDKLGNDFLNAYKASGGTVNQPKPGAESPGPRTKAEETTMQAFLDKKKEEDMKRRLMAKNSPRL